MIKPTVGRVVWFSPASDDPNISTFYRPPFAAHIAYVWNEHLVNLMVIGPEGHTLQYTSVELVQEGEAVPTFGRYCEWMPYQKGQAAKTEALEAKVAG